MTTGFMMGFPNTSNTEVQETNGGLLYDPNVGTVYGVATTSVSGLNGIRKWDAYPNGFELRARDLADLGLASGMFDVHCLLYRQQLIVMSTGTSNTAALNSYAMQDLSYKGSFGVNSSVLAPSDSNRILASDQVVAFCGKYGDVVVATQLVSGAGYGGAEINCVAWGTLQNQKSNITENHAALGALPDGSGKNAWALGYNGGSDPMTLYRIGPTLGGNGVQATLGSVTVAQIDPTWTTVNSVYGIAVDQTDGNLIVGFSTLDAVTHSAYLVKLNSATAAVMWAVPVGNTISFGTRAGNIQKAVIKNGKLYYLPPAGTHLYVVDTIAGTADSSLNFDIGTPKGTQISEDVSGSLIYYGDWSEQSLHPAYLGNYCLTQGNHSGSKMVWRFWPGPGGDFVAPVPGTVATSRKRAWSFTLDGHTFYVLDLGEEGTFLWDKSTNSWAQFITTGYTAWNFCNGCMWGQRIIAGDQLTTDIWEMLPASSLFDNGATVVQHVVTGGLATRNRIYHSVESFTLVASTALLMDPSGATVTLSFSDDQGVTWQDMDTLTLTGASDQEVAWTSLGAFCNPGRIFKITDQGAFLRIDGADANIDNFDEQPPAG